jgi:hypothetical protein
VAGPFISRSKPARHEQWIVMFPKRKELWGISRYARIFGLTRHAQASSYGRMSPCRMLNEYNVVLDAILLKPNMVLPGVYYKRLNP